MSQTTRVINAKSVHGIMNKRTVVNESMVGKKVRLTVRGNGTTIDVRTKDGAVVQSVVEPGTVFQKVIFNTESNSGIALASAANKQLAAEGMAAEKAGNAELAHEKFTAFLNAVQLSFNVPTSSTILHKLGDRIDISARIVKVTTENGSLLTIDPATIAVLAPEELAVSTFDLNTFAGVGEEKKEDAPTAEELKEVLADGATPPVVIEA